MLPINQRCPKCGTQFEGSDAIGYTCLNCTISEELRPMHPSEELRPMHLMIYDFYEVRARLRTTYEWVTIGKRQAKYVRKEAKPKWWQFWKSRYDYEKTEPEDLYFLYEIFGLATIDPKYTEIQMVGYIELAEQAGSSLIPDILRCSPGNRCNE